MKQLFTMLALLAAHASFAGVITWHPGDPEQAMAQASREGKPVMVDVYATWCPPCNYLNEHVFNNGEVAAAAERWISARLDADKTESFAFKSKYNIAGYPTVLFLKPDGTELGRLVGSETAANFKLLLDKYFAQVETIEARQASMKADAKLKADILALAKYYEGRNEPDTAHKYYTFALEMAELSKDELCDALAGELTWAAKQKLEAECLAAADRLIKEKPKATQLAMAYAGKLSCYDKEKDAKAYKLAAEEQEKALAAALPTMALAGNDAVEVYDLAIDLAKEAGKDDLVKAYSLKAIAILEAQLAGQQPLPKSSSLDLLYFYSLAGETGKQDALLNELLAAYPSEFTMHHAQAKAFYKRGKYDEALVALEKAESFAYGDNALFVASLKADVLEAQGRKKAAEYLDSVLAKTQVDAGLKVSTHKYLDKLKKRAAELGTLPKK